MIQPFKILCKISLIFFTFYYNFLIENHIVLDKPIIMPNSNDIEVRTIFIYVYMQIDILSGFDNKIKTREKITTISEDTVFILNNSLNNYELPATF